MYRPLSNDRESGLTLRSFAQLRSVALLCALQMLFFPVFSARAQTPNVIIPDGRTGTSLQTSGNVTNITTTTVSGPNAFNSFSQFGVGQGNTVNLQLPNGSRNLINIVRDAPAYVNGTLNSYANGQIGGNVYFADPHGFVVGKTGTVNVGSLNVSTPTREFTEKLVSRQGQIDNAAVASLMNGSFPISPDGNIRILGRVNAIDGVKLVGQNVFVGGGRAQRDQVNAQHASKFSASVNSRGLRSASAISVRNGSIHIGAVNNATINGRLTARSRTNTPSNITVAAGNNIEIGKNAVLRTASKTGDAGDVLVRAGNNLTVKGGAAVNASSTKGNAGLVELSGNTFDIGSGIKINLGAPNGKAGTLLMDPTDVVIGDAAQGDTGVTLSNTSVANAIAALSNGGTYQVLADNSVTLAAHAIIDTRRLDGAGHSQGNAFNIQIVAPNIELKNGAKILAQIVNFGGTTYTSGDVTLTASASDNRLSGQATASTGITIDGQITGGAITISATSEAVSSFTSSIVADFALVGASLAPQLLGLNGGYVAASATAKIAINTHANINGTGNVTINAQGTEKAEVPVLSGALNLLPFSASVVVGKIAADVSTNVANGATISAGGSLAIKSANFATMNVSAVSASASAQFVETVAYSTGSVSTVANVATGANLSVNTSNANGNAFSLRAVNTNSFSTSATSVALSTPSVSGGVGGALAISDLTTSATATLGASLGSGASRMNGAVVVEALSNTSVNSTMASTIVGTPALVNALQEFALSSIAPTRMIFAFMGPLFSTSFNFKLAGALSIANSTQNATAAIAQNPSGGAPNIWAAGDVSVVSSVIDRGVRSNSTASAITSDVAAGEGTAISAAVAWGTFNHNSNAYIGAGTLINARNIAVDATTYMPITNTWLKWDGFAEVLRHLNGNLGVGGTILTSYASSTADAGDTIGIAGAVNRFQVNNNTTAWVATGASLTATCTTACGTNWSSAISNGDVRTYDASLTVTANTYMASIDAGGNVGTAGFLPANTSGGSSVGGALNLIQFNTKTIAGVAGSLRAEDDIGVTATTTDLFFGVAPSSGKAAGALALNGITSIALVNNTTHASISGGSVVVAPTVGITAQQDLSVLTLAGAIVASAGSSVGLSVTYLGANTDTAAYVGDNHIDIRPGIFSANDPFSGTGGGSGSIGVDHLAVSATTSGRVTAVAIAAAISEPSVSEFANKASAVGAAATGGGAGVGIASARLAQKSGTSTDGFNIDLAGSSAITDSAMDTAAYVSGITINRFTPTSTTASTLVQAQNLTILNNASGSAAFNLSAMGSPSSVAIGGAIASAMSDNATLAYINSTTINNHKSVSVQALSGGEQTIVALGVAGGNANSVALSASVGIITDSVNAYILDSALNGLSGGSSRAVEVDAYQATNIAIGGGSLYISGATVGIGIGLTYASIGNPGGNAADAHIRSTTINEYDTLTVLADNVSAISAGAASGGAGANGASGAIVVSELTTTTTAYISSNATTNISVTGAVTVTANSVRVSALDTSLNNLVRATNNGQLASTNCTTSSGTQSCIDFSAAALNDGVGNGPGASITAVAGLIQAGKNNVGVSIVYSDIATTHSAYIAHVLLTSSSGNVAVTAADSSKIQSVSIGFGLATGQFAGVGGMTISSIGNTVSAAVGDATSDLTNSSITAANLAVTAYDNARIIGSAAVAGASTQGAAAGLSIVYADIKNDVIAQVSKSKVVSSGDVNVSATSDAAISTVAVGVAMSSSVGLAGSVSTNLLGTNVTAKIVDGSDVMATDNVGVLADNTDSAAVFAGAFAISKGAAGGAGSLVTNKITGSTKAYISGGTTKVDAKGTNSGNTLSVNSGALAHGFAFQAPTDDTPDLSETQQTVKGLAVVASSHQAVVTNVASLAASSGISIMINPIVNVMSGTTSAYIADASIDTRLTSSTLAPQIVVGASSFSYSGAFGLGIVAPTSSAGGGATILSTTMDRATYAYITRATVGGVAGSSATVGAVTVRANAEQYASSVAVGFNSGSVGLNTFQATTEAYVDGGGLTATSLSVKAKDVTSIASANGSGAYGSAVAIGAAFLVQVSANKTLAYIGDEYHYRGGSAAHTTAINLSGALVVDANTTTNFQAYSVGGALSTGTAAVAGMANIEIANNTTIAGIYDTTVQGVTGGTSGAVSVTATEDVAIKEIAGALAIGAAGGGVGVGAAANIIVFKSQTTAETRNSNLNSSGAVTVNALSTKEVLSYAVTAGAGGTVGIGATVGVVIIGTNTADPATQGQQTDNLNNNGNGTIAAVNARTNANHGSDAVAAGTAGNPGGANASSTYDVSSVLTGGNDGVTAQIAGGNVTGTAVQVSATSANAAQQFLLGAGFGKNVGIGAAIGYTNVSTSVLANLSAIVAAPSVSVEAVVKDAATGPYAGKTVNNESIAGGIALHFGADASVSVGNVANSVTAQVGGSVTGSGGTGVSVAARDTSTQSVTAGGGSGGIAAIGASIATTGKSSTVQSKVLSNATVNASTVSVVASEAGALSTTAIGVGGGVVAGQGAAATSTESSTVLAEIGSGASITTATTGAGTLVSAAVTPNLSSDAIGIAVGGGAVGVSVAKSNVTATVTADVGDNTTFSGGDLAIAAMALVPSGGTTTYAKAIAGGGGSLIGLQGSYAQASQNATVNAYGGTGVHLPSADVVIAAQNDSAQYAQATGVAFGYIAGGATVAQTSSNAHTHAYLGEGAVTAGSNTGVLQITATGTDANVSDAIAGSGGTFAAAASVATTNTTAVTDAVLRGNGTSNTLYFGGLNIQAKHTTNYAGSGDAYQASSVGASGGSSINDVVSTTTAEVGTNLIVNSFRGDMVVISNDIVNQAGGGARSGSGGAAAGAAALGNTHVTQNVNTLIDAGTILSLNDDPLTSTAKIDIEAYNTLRTTDTAALTAGGLFAGGGAQSNMTAVANLTVNIAATELFSAGNLYVGSSSSMIANNNANANLYGAVTGAGASTSTFVEANQNVTISGNSRLEAWGVINLYAGLAGNGGAYSTVSANATTTVYNYAIIPITALFRGTAVAHDYTNLTLQAGSQVLGANNIFLGAHQGNVNASGKGTNYIPFLTAFSTKVTDDHSSVVGTGAVSMNGVVVAGIHNQQTITIAVGANTPTVTSTSPYGLALELVASPDNFNPVMSYNHQKIQYAVVGGFNPYQTIVTQLATLSGKTATEIQTVLSGAAPSILIDPATDPTGDIQRQINTLIQQAPFAANTPGSAFAFGDILVSAGNVSILAQTLTGTAASGQPAPSVTARDSVSINIDNQGLNFVALSKLSVSGVTGGRVNFTGAATNLTSSGITYNSDLVGTTPIVNIASSYNRKDPNTGQGVDTNGVVLTKTPDIYFEGTVTNVNGLLKITNALGNVVAAQTYNAATIELQVPNGSFTFNGGIGSIFNSNNDVASQWSSVQFRPTDTLTAVMTAATYLGTYGSVYLAGNGNYHPYSSYCCVNGTQVVSGVAANNTIFTARMMNLYYDGLSLYSAIFLPAMSVPGNLAQIEGANPAIVSTAPWESHTYDGQGVYADSGSPFHCSGCAAYFQVINIQSAAITPITTDTVPNPPNPGTFAVGKAIILSASVLNINGTIQSGNSSNYSVNIGTNAKNFINGLRNDADLLAQAQTNAQRGSYIDITPYVSTVNGSDVKVGARYDALNNQILLNGVVQGSGGYVYLNGRIISTSTSGTPQGNIVVNGGAGTITVNNSTGVNLVTNTINTGVSAASVIQIVDQLKLQTTWYVYNAGAPAGQQVSTYRTNGVTSSGYQSAALIGVSGPSGINYSVAPNQYYQWVDTATLTRPVTSGPSDYGWTFSGVSANSPYAPYTRTTSLVSNVQEVLNGAPTGRLQSSNFQEVIYATGDYHENNFNTGAGKCCGSDRQFDWFQQIYHRLALTMVNTVKASYDIGIHFNGGGTSSVAVTSNSSIVLNGPINNLQGVTSVVATGANSSITVGANANNPLISGTSVTLSAAGGIGSLTSNAKTPVPVQVYGGTLTANSTDRDIAIAATGSLLINQVKVNSATPGAAPQGNVFLSATGDINSASAYNPASPVVVGKSIEIATSGGAIGATSGLSNGVTVLTNLKPLVIQATGTTQIDGSVDGGLLNSSSSNGTYIAQSAGDLRLGAISSNGPVFLAAMASDGHAASILNGRASDGLTAEQSAYLQTVWTSLNLLNGSGTAAVNDYQSMVTAAYNDYWQLRNLAFASGSYSLTTTGDTVLRAQVAARLGIAPGAVTTTDMQTEATQRFEKAQFLLGLKNASELTNSLTTLFGSNLAGSAYLQAAPTNAALTAALTTYNANFSYTLASNTSLYSAITSGSRWTHDQLAYTVSEAANPATGAAPPPIDTLPLNVSARQVMLYAPNGSIGNLAAPQSFSFTSIDSSMLTATQKGLLASAGPGQLTVSSTTDANTGVINYTVNVSQQSLVMLKPLDAVSAKAQSQIYLGSVNDLVLGGIASGTFGPIAAAQANGIQTIGGGDIKLNAVGSILNGATNQAVISGPVANLTLITQNGSIGQAPSTGTNPAVNANALQLSLTGANSQLDQAVAGQGIYVKQTTGDLVVGNITASGAIQLAATGSIYAEPQFTDLSAVHIAGASLDLRAGGDISFNGSSFHPLQVQISGAVTGSAGGDFSIRAPSSNLIAGATGTWGTLTAGGALTLNAVAGSLTIRNDLSSVDAMQLLANGAITFADGTSADALVAASSNGAVTLAGASLSMGDWSAVNAAGKISVTTTGDAVIGQLNSTLTYAAAGNGPSLEVTAGGVTAGAIRGNGDGQVNFIASGAGAAIALSASTGIGTSTTRMGLNAARLTASTTDGGIYLKSFADLDVSLLSAVKGNVDLLGTGHLTLGNVLAGTATGASGAVTVATTGGSIVIGTATSSGTQDIHATQDVTFKALATTGNSGDTGSISVHADNGFILAQTVTSGGVITLGSVAANGGATLVAGTTITGNTLNAVTGSATLNASGAIVWNTLAAATTLALTSSHDSIGFRTAQSGGSQTIHADQNVTFNALTATGIAGDAGNIGVNADHGFVLAQTVTSGGVTTQGSVAANGSASLIAGTTITANTLAATTGAATLGASGPIVWNTLTAGTTLAATSTGASITLGSAQTGGAQTLHANQNVTFDQLTTNGIAGDAGNVTVNADTGRIGGGSIHANGSARLVAATSNTGVNLTTTTGGAFLQGQVINWGNLAVAKTLDVTATTGGITLGTTTSGGTQSLHAAGNIAFSQLATTGIAGDVGDISLVSDAGSILGGSVYANGDTSFTTSGSISLDRLRGSTVSLASPNDLSINFVSVVKQLNLAANTINVVGEQVPSNPSIPLIMNITGFRGGVAKSANVTIDPNLIIINQYRVVDSTFITDAPSVVIVDGFVPGRLMLTTATQQVLLDNRSPAPSAWGNLQLYQPNGVFTFSQLGNASFTDSYIVQYNGDQSATVLNFNASHTCCSVFTGASMVRNIANETQGTETIDTWLAQKSGPATFYQLGLAGTAWLDALRSLKPVQAVGEGPAVNIKGISELRKLRRLQQGQKTSGPVWRSTELRGASQGPGQFADAR